MDKGQAQFLFEQTGMFIGVVKFFALQHDFAADRFGLHDFDGGGSLGHHNGYRRAQSCSVIA